MNFSDKGSFGIVVCQRLSTLGFSWEKLSWLLPQHGTSRIKLSWYSSFSILVTLGFFWMLYCRGCYFQVGDSLKLGMSIPTAFKVALDTWASWVDRTIDQRRTRVFIRTFEPSHWRYSATTPVPPFNYLILKYSPAACWPIINKSCQIMVDVGSLANINFVYSVQFSFHVSLDSRLRHFLYTPTSLRFREYWSLNRLIAYV